MTAAAHAPRHTWMLSLRDRTPGTPRTTRTVERTVETSCDIARSEYHRALRHYHDLVRHRIANPLLVICGMAETLRDIPDLDSETQEAMLQAIVDASVRLGSEALFDPQRHGIEEQELDAIPREEP